MKISVILELEIYTFIALGKSLLMSDCNFPTQGNPFSELGTKYFFVFKY